MMGIYKIENTINGKCYYGRSREVNHRLGEHKSRLLNGKHPNRPLMLDWWAFGPEAFKFELVCTAQTLDQLCYLESYYIQTYEAKNPLKGYNRLAGLDYMPPKVIKKKPEPKTVWKPDRTNRVPKITDPNGRVYNSAREIITELTERPIKLFSRAV